LVIPNINAKDHFSKKHWISISKLLRFLKLCHCLWIVWSLPIFDWKQQFHYWKIA
jgi:hypothetical protein